MVSDWERGVRMPTPSALLGLAQFASPREAIVLLEIEKRTRSRRNAHLRSGQIAIAPHSTSIQQCQEQGNV